jgi:hypothetical protein
MRNFEELPIEVRRRSLPLASRAHDCTAQERDRSFTVGIFEKIVVVIVRSSVTVGFFEKFGIVTPSEVSSVWWGFIRVSCGSWRLFAHSWLSLVKPWLGWCALEAIASIV